MITLSLRTLAPALLALGLAACRHGPSEKDRDTANSHYQLGLIAQQNGDVREAYREFEQALQADPGNAEVHQSIGILLHLSFGRPAEAERHYLRALELKPGYSEAKTNLGNVYLDQGRYDDAIRLYREALADMLYPTPFIAQGNLGWALYKKGQLQQALAAIRGAVAQNPRFCLGYRNLGIIHEETGDGREACRQYARFRETCPEAADAWRREGVCQARSGQVDEARNSFAQCEARAQAGELKDTCRQLGDQLRGG